MLQSDLYRSLSRATAETVATIKRLGFLIAEPQETISDPDADQYGPHVIDWDEFRCNQEAFDGTSAFNFSV